MKKVYFSVPTIHREAHYIKRMVQELTPLFHEMGYCIVSPLNNIERYPKDTFEDAVAHDLVTLMGCDAIFMTKDWQTSKHCQVEKACAEIYNIPTIKLKEYDF